MIAVLTGGTGGAKLVDGLARVVPQSELSVIVNTGDDLKWWGLSVSPDIDSIVYVLAGLLSEERGWGYKQDTFCCLQTMAGLGEEAWFKIGDRDLAVHLLRSNLLAEGRTLTETTREICSRLNVSAQIFPMTDSKVETRVRTPTGEISFEEYFVKRRYRDKVLSVRFAGAEEACPPAGVLEAIFSADAIIIAPSNPITSIGPILAIPKIRQALRDSDAEVIAISPIVGNLAVSGPAAELMASQGLPVSVAGIAHAYEDFLDILIVDHADANAAALLEHIPIRLHCANTIMRNAEDRALLARETLSRVALRAVAAKS